MIPPRPFAVRAARCAAVAVVGIATLAGCVGTRPGAEDATATVRGFYAAVARRDGAAACEMLAPATLEAIEDASQQTCAAAVLAGEVGSALAERAAATEVERSTVAGRQALVTLSGDTVFLTVSGDRWLVTALACDARPNRPYDCVVEGG